MTAMYRSRSLENKELMALYGGDRDPYFVRDEDCTSEEYDLDSECSEEGKGGRGLRSSVSLEIYGLQREQHVYFSNQEYYRRLEELKNAHLRNMAELERMYISQGREWHAEEEEEEEDGDLARWRSREARHSVSSCPARKLQRINSQEELDFHETSSGSDQSELCGEDSMGELELENRRRTRGQVRTFGRDVLLSPEDMMTQKQFRFQPKALCPKPQGRLSRHTGGRVRSNAKVTVPKPFQMMLREEDRKRQKVRTRSEIELENTLLRRELEELRECQKKFKASPAPAHIHLPLYEVISRRPGQRPNQRRSSSNNCNRDSKSNKASAAASSQPFHFLERERRKREAKVVAELGNLGQKEERQAFKARPMPSSVYGTKHRADSKTTNRQPQFFTICTLEREATEGQSDPNSDLEAEALQSNSDTSPASCGPQRCASSKPVKKQIELSIEMVKEREWSYIDPLKATACNVRSPGGPEPLLCHKSDCISV
ncbi:protein FAM161A-like [Seriola aureovittata]|uniref:protein FAM161A-like n=1 Tax=Seriola aureovittata TaxID=2871759 RepID=UPI0024BDB326|nr:protein FAM161A-like [Seriola aureovittata]